MDTSHETYSALLKRHWLMLWRMCWHHCHGNRTHCQDMMQDICIALWLNLHKLRPDATPGQERAWVRWQARSVFYQSDRYHKPIYVPIDTVGADLASDDTHPDTERLDDLLSTLSPDERRLLLLRLEGYDGTEIGLAMGISRDTVYQRTKRAIVKIRHAILVLLAVLPLFVAAIAIVPGVRHLIPRRTTTTDTIVDTSPHPTQSSPVDETDTTSTTTAKNLHSRRTIIPIEKMPPTTLDNLFQSQKPTVHPLADIQTKPTVAVSGRWLTVHGAKYENVQVFDARGRQIVAQMAYADYVIVELPDYAMYRNCEFLVCIGTHSPMSIRP